MRTRLATLATAALAVLGGGLGSAIALINVPTPVGTLGIDDGNGYLVVFDAISPLPFTGYIGITTTPGCAFGLTGGPYEEGEFHTPLACENFSPGPGVPVPVPVPPGVPPLPPPPI